jgi:hypothetical protein
LPCCVLLSKYCKMHAEEKRISQIFLLLTAHSKTEIPLHLESSFSPDYAKTQRYHAAEIRPIRSDQTIS